MLKAVDTIVASLYKGLLMYLAPTVQPHFSQQVAELRKAGLIDCHANGTLRRYYLLRPSRVRRMIRLLREAHPSRSRSRDSVLHEARRGSGMRKRVARGSVLPASHKAGAARRRGGGGFLRAR